MVFATSSRCSTERHGDFSESVVFHFASLVSFCLLCCSVLVVGCFAVLFFLFWWMTSRFLSHLLSHTGDWQSKQNVLMTVRASSAHGNGKKKKHLFTPTHLRIALYLPTSVKPLLVFPLPSIPPLSNGTLHTLSFTSVLKKK